MIESDKKMSIVDFTPKILRAIRKFHGLNQVELANVLHVRQGTLSKIEGGKLELSAIQWINITSKFSIDPYCIFTGRLELPTQFALEPSLRTLAKEKIGGFKLPNRYSEYAGSTVRANLPLLRYLEFHMGQTNSHEQLKQMGLDPDFFTILNLPININFRHDLFNQLLEKGLIGAVSLGQIFNITPPSDIHKKILKELKTTENESMNLKRYMKTIPLFYDADFEFYFVGKNDCFIQVRLADHLNNFDLSDEFLNFQMKYCVANFNQIARILNSNYHFSAIPVAGGWDIISEK